MLYDDISELKDTESTLDMVIFLGVRNYISGMTIMYASDDLVEGHKYAFRFGSSEYSGGVVPSILPFICSGGVYNDKLGSSVSGIVMADAVSGVLYGQFGGVEDAVGTVGQYTTFNAMIDVTMDIKMHIHGSQLLNPIPPEIPSEGEDE
jgi:hypothetical protein